MRTIKLTSGTEIPLDGDLLTILETLYRDLTGRRALDYSFEEVAREIAQIVEQMTDEERRQYFNESLFLNFVSYENERLAAYVNTIATTEEAGTKDTAEPVDS